MTYVARAGSNRLSAYRNINRGDDYDVTHPNRRPITTP